MFCPWLSHCTSQFYIQEQYNWSLASVFFWPVTPQSLPFTVSIAVIPSQAVRLCVSNPKCCNEAGPLSQMIQQSSHLSCFVTWLWISMELYYVNDLLDCFNSTVIVFIYFHMSFPWIRDYESVHVENAIISPTRGDNYPQIPQFLRVTDYFI